MPPLRLLSRFALPALALGGLTCLAWLQYELAQLHNQARALRAESGIPEIKDPSKMYVTAIKTGDPLYWRWNIYLPTGRSVNFKLHSTGGIQSGGEFSSAPGESNLLKLSLRARREANGTINLKVRSSHNTSFFTAQSAAPGYSNWGEGHYSVDAIVDKTTALDLDGAITLLSIRADKVGGTPSKNDVSAPGLLVTMKGQSDESLPANGKTK